MAAPSLIALYSPVMQSGKSEVANTLIRERGFHLVKFADGLKAVAGMVLSSLGLSSEGIHYYLEGEGKAEVIPQLGITGRVLMQRTGSDYGRDLLHPQVWVRGVYARLKHHAAQGHDVVIDDLRFPNELSMVLQAGGTPLKVFRPGAVKYNSHQSEGLLDNHPMPTLVNSGTLEQLREAALQLPGFLRGVSP